MATHFFLSDLAYALHKRWTIVTVNGRRVTLYKALGASRIEVQRMYPDALSVEPIEERRKTT